MTVTAQTTVRAFEGMVCPDTHPLTVPDRFVRPVSLFEVPPLLRDYAYQALGDMSGGQWWTVGEFRYQGEEWHDTAVARRVLREGRMTVEFGTECE